MFSVQAGRHVAGFSFRFGFAGFNSASDFPSGFSSGRVGRLQGLYLVQIFLLVSVQAG